MDKANKLNDVCVFCFKTVEDNVQLRNNDVSQTVDKFCIFLRRICAKRFKELRSPSQQLPTCDACLSIMDSFNELYHQVQCLQLQMEWRLDKLKNVIKCADKVPSRLKAFQKRYAMRSVMQPNGEFDGKSYQMLDTRNIIQLRMTTYLSNVFPRVRLDTHISNLKHCKINKKMELKPCPKPSLHLNFNASLEWLKTVIAVTICCLPIVHYHYNAPVSIPETLKNCPEIVYISDVSEPDAINRNCSNLEVVEKNNCSEQISSPIPSPDNFEDAVTDSLAPTTPMDECHMEEVERMNIDDECTLSNNVAFEPQVKAPAQLMKPEQYSTAHLEQLSSSTKVKIICLTAPEQINDQKETIEQSVVQNSTESVEDQTCTNSKVESEIPSRTRQLRSQYKCKNCTLTFSTSTRLSEHSKSCSSTNDNSESEDEDAGEEDITAQFSDKASNYDMSSDASENELKEELPMEEESSSDFSDEDEIKDIKPIKEKKVRITKPRCEIEDWSLEKCLEAYKKTNGQTQLSEKDVSTLNLTATDIQLKGFEFLETCKLPGCDSGLFSKDELEYHQSLHGQFKCDLCGFSSNFATKIILHELKHNSNRENELCPRCPDVKVDAVNYRQHFVEHHLEANVKYKRAQCPVCSMTFPKTDLVPLVHFVNEHDISRLNDPEKVFNCDEDNCSAYFLTVKQLIDHSKIVHNKTKRFWSGKLFECLIECDICSQKFPYVSDLNLHKKTKHGETTDGGLTVVSDDGLTINDILDDRAAKFPCLVASCKRKYFTEGDRDTHFKHHGTFKCNFCPVEKDFAPDLARHELEHADSLNIRSSLFPSADYKCRRCAFGASRTQRYIDHHILEHLNLPPDKVTVNCPICKLQFTSTVFRKTDIRRSLYAHFVKQHDKSKITDAATLLNCAHCPAYFLTQMQLHFHNKHAHREKMSLGMNLTCDDCHRKFGRRDGLLKHRINVHHKNDDSGYKFICEVDNCNKRFEYQCDLDHHAPWHSRFKSNSIKYTPKPCPECGINNFKNQFSYDRHLKTHQIQEHVCTQCGKTFPSKSRLADHMLFHSGPENWQFTCDVCSRRFRSKKDLGHHKQTHPNTTPCPLSGSLDECLEKYKQTNGKIPLSRENIETLKLSGTDIHLKYLESSLESCNMTECKPGLYSTADLEYHRHLHGNFQCSFCEYNSSFAINLIEHELEHNSNLENGVCPRCPGVKVDKSDYKKHFVEHHLETSVKYRCAQCPVCSKSFPETDQVPLLHFVNEHDVSRLNDPEKVFKCDKDNCSAYFLTAKQLIGHSKDMHNIEKKLKHGRVAECVFACDNCPMTFLYPSGLTQHKKKKHKQPSDETNETYAPNFTANFPCLVVSCKNKFYTEENRNAHSKLHGNFKCTFCPVTKSFAPDLALHEIRLHSKPKTSLPDQATFNCSQCEFNSKKRDRCIRHHLEKHLDFSPDSFTVNCPICKQRFNDNFLGGFRNEGVIGTHFRTHHDKTGITDPTSLFNCVHCSAYFLERTQLQLHNQRVHPEQVQSLSKSCADCHKQFYNRGLLLTHRTKLHHNNDESGYEFICQVGNCNKRFEHECDLEYHITWHSRFTSKPCPECGKVLMNQGAYAAHVKSHQDQGHVCEQCGKKFKHKAQLTVHTVYHTGPDSWLFMCDICSLKCPSKYKLAEHKKVHSKTKPYVCEKCGATYAQRHNWRHHMIRKHGVPDFTRKITKTANTTSRKGVKNQQNVANRRKRKLVSLNKKRC